MNRNDLPALGAAMILPESMQEIADVIGREKAFFLLALVQTHSLSRGTSTRPRRVSIYVPKRLRPGHWLVRYLGRADAERMRKHFGGATLQPANCSDLVAAGRDVVIREMALEGASPRFLAWQFGLTERQIRNVVPAEQRRGPWKAHLDRAPRGSQGSDAPHKRPAPNG